MRRFHFLVPSDFQKALTLIFVQGLVQAGILIFFFCPYTQEISIEHHNIKSKIGTS